MTDDNDPAAARGERDADANLQEKVHRLLEGLGLLGGDEGHGIPVNLMALTAAKMKGNPLLLSLAAASAERLVNEIVLTLAAWDEDVENNPESIAAGKPLADLTYTERHSFMMAAGRLAFARDELHDLHESIGESASGAGVGHLAFGGGEREMPRVDFVDSATAASASDVPDDAFRDAATYAERLTKTRTEALKRVRARSQSTEPDSDA